MDVSELEETLFAASDAKLHGGMCKQLSAVYCKILSIFPSLEAARPRSKPGIQALCSLHIALEKAKIILQHCSECSKLYLAITGDSVVLKFKKAKSALIDSLRSVDDIVPRAIGSQILEIVNELECLTFSIDPSEKEVGDQIITLLQHGRKFDSGNDNHELEIFHRAATRLAITSSRAALAERRALKKLIERARAEDDKRKESIVAYLLHLMRKYSKLFRSEALDENDNQVSSPCSPTPQCCPNDSGGGSGHPFAQELSTIGSFNFKPKDRKSRPIPVPPEELRCPISLQLMYDPVIIASGQTYERVCVEKWFNDGHNTCPKTQQQLPHLSLTPNYCVKGLIASWCEQNGVPVPSSPPESLDLNYWRLALSDSDSPNSRSLSTNGSCKIDRGEVFPVRKSCTVEEEEPKVQSKSVEQESLFNTLERYQESDFNILESYQYILAVLNEGTESREKFRVVERIRQLLKDDEEARIFMGAHGFVDALLRFLELAVRDKNALAQEVGAIALFNLAVNNNRNKELMLASGVILLLEKMILNSDSQGPATALYLNLSCLEKAKPIIGSSPAVPFLIELLRGESDTQCKLDALHTLYNLSTWPPNIPTLLAFGIIYGLQSLAFTGDHLWTEKSLAVLLNLASSEAGKQKMMSAPGLITSLATVLDSGGVIEQEQSVACLLVLCTDDEKCSEIVLQEGVIPSLVSISVNGTPRGREKAQKLLMLFREQRQRDHSQVPEKVIRVDTREESVPPTPGPASGGPSEPKPLLKSISTRRMARPFSFFWKKSYSIHH